MILKKVDSFIKFGIFCEATRRFSYSLQKFAPIAYAELTGSGNSLKVRFSNGEHPCEYPSSFLQDNCTCPKCFHPSSRSRSRKMTELNLNNLLKSVEYCSDEVKCVWNNGHEGVFSEKWLKDRRFTKENIQARKTGFRDDPILIGSNHTMHTACFKETLNNPLSLAESLKILSQVGVILIKDAPKEIGQLRRLAQKIGFIRLTHYGHEFTVKSEKNAVNLAYTSETLCVHTDLPYYVYPPGVQLLHCIKQFIGIGGRSHLVDGFLVAEQMKQNFSEEYKTLYQVPVEFYDVGKDYTEFYKVHHSPTFVLSPTTARLTRIVYSNQQLSSYQPIPLEKVDAVYKALKLFTDLCYQPENLMQFKLNDGDILVFDNWRFLHGREGFDPNAGDRHLEGCYIDWDEIFSRIRVLESLPIDKSAPGSLTSL